jgi:tetratricopeptide (TPR) repeat protein/tRNA A-37 threonylcarbamoyl transferase component Bud32
MTARLLPGHIIPGTRYRVLAKVGQGAMGVVYAAEHVDLEKRVAIKLLAGKVAQRADAVDRFRHEARTASKIGSPYICDVTDFGQLPDGRVFLVMEYLEGPSLRAVLDHEGHVAPERAIPILRQAAKALGAAHDKGIIHLDVKPDNVMLAPRARRELVKVVDFGVAGLLTEQPLPEPQLSVNGTPAYMAPERALGRGYDHRSDIYSLGVMSYEALTGSIPFESDDIVTTLRRHVHDPPEPLRDRAPDHKIPAELEDVIFRMLSKDPASRPQSMAEVEGLLCEAQIAAGLTTTWDDLELPHVDDAWRSKLAARMPSPWSRRVKSLTAATLALAVVGAGVGIYFGVFKKRVVLVPVEITRTDEPAPVAEQLYLAARAFQAKRYVEPADDSALYHVERAEEQAERLSLDSPGARTLRQTYATALTSVGDSLLEAGLQDLGIAKYKEALLFDAANPELQRKAQLSPNERQAYVDRSRRKPSQRAAPKTSTDEQAKGVAASLFEAASKGRISEARSQFKLLQQVDRTGLHTGRVADALRNVARKAWNAGHGRSDDARALYRLMVELDPSDLEARERSRPAPAPPPAPAPAPAAAAAAPPEPPKVQAARKPDPKPESAPAAEDVPRNPQVSRASAEEGRAALAKGWLDQAEVAFRRAIRADPLNPVAVGGMAEVAFERARYAEALDYGRRATRLAPRSTRLLTILGDSYFKLLRFDEARAAYQKALQLSPKDAQLQSRIQRVKASVGEK